MTQARVRRREIQRIPPGAKGNLLQGSYDSSLRTASQASRFEFDDIRARIQTELEHTSYKATLLLGKNIAVLKSSMAKMADSRLHLLLPADS